MLLPASPPLPPPNPRLLRFISLLASERLPFLSAADSISSLAAG